MLNVSQKSIWIVFVSTAVCACIFVVALSSASANSIDAMNTISTFTESSFSTASVREKHPPIKVKGLYLTAYSAGSAKKINEIIKLIDNTELNAVVIDIKDYSGYILYDSKLKFVKDYKLKDVRIKDLRALIAKLKSHDIYTIARISTFQDPILAETKSDWAIKRVSRPTALWRDKNNLAWVNAARPEIWSYTVSVAKEASDLGFDEINLDYIRFPTDGNLADIKYDVGGRKRYEVVRDFFKYFSEQMQSEPVYISADLFGLTTERTGEDDMRIGQRLQDAAEYFDYVCPMVYPSHYPSGYMGYKNPADYPYQVVYHAMSAGQKRVADQKAHLRAWVQAFNMGAIYGGDKIRAQIDATDKAGADGWILWNARNVYSNAGLKLNE